MAIKKVTQASVVEYDETGGPEVLHLVTRPLPEPGRLAGLVLWRPHPGDCSSGP